MIDLVAACFWLPLKGTLKLTLLSLCESAGDDASTWTSEEYIAARVGVTVRQTQGHLKSLLEQGWFAIKGTRKGVSVSEADLPRSHGRIVRQMAYDRIIQEGRRRHDEYRTKHGRPVDNPVDTVYMRAKQSSSSLSHEHEAGFTLIPDEHEAQHDEHEAQRVGKSVEQSKKVLTVLEPNKTVLEPNTGGKFTAQSLAILWNEIVKEPSVRKLAGTRFGRARLRISENPDQGFWQTVLDRIVATPFLRGSKGWRADFDWLVRNETNAHAVLEGKYGNSNGLGDFNRSVENQVSRVLSVAHDRRSAP